MSSAAAPIQLISTKTLGKLAGGSNIDGIMRTAHKPAITIMIISKFAATRCFANISIIAAAYDS
jgi:hypothetical protein